MKNKRFVLRLTSELYDRIKVHAEVAERSVNSQIFFILKEWVARHDKEV